MSLHLEVLSPEQQEALRQLGRPASECGFYLGGGTAIAAHLGHRHSQDLDWFTGNRIEDPFALANVLNERGAELHVASAGRATLHGDIRGVRTSFLEYRHPNLASVIPWPELGCELASLGDLAAMKLLAIDQRGAKRDFFDIHALASQWRPLSEMLELFKQKFGVSDVSRALYSLSYFDDAESDPMPRMLTDITWESVKDDIRTWITSITSSGG